MARKKEKIRVDLELPKDDNTQSTFVAILLIGMLMGIVSSVSYTHLTLPPTPFV